jgi:hypothetical protein
LTGNGFEEYRIIVHIAVEEGEVDLRAMDVLLGIILESLGDQPFPETCLAFILNGECQFLVGVIIAASPDVIVQGLDLPEQTKIFFIRRNGRTLTEATPAFLDQGDPSPLF